MRYLGLALYAEGKTDYQFLMPILRRVADDLCLHGASEPVTIGEVIALDAPHAARSLDRPSRILAAAKVAEGAFDILFIHTDGDSDPRRAQAERVEPAIQRMIAEGLKSVEGIVSVVPVRETEAWALADGDALRQTLGTILDDETLGLPGRVNGVENLIDPKQILKQVYEKAGGRRRPGRNPSRILDILGERLRLEILRKVPSFQEFETDFLRALKSLRYLRE